MNELFVQITDEAACDLIELAKVNRYGVEIICFALPWIHRFTMFSFYY